jgi:hypothetical protein
MKDSKIIKWNIKWLVISTILILGVVLLTSFRHHKKKFRGNKSITSERDYYKQEKNS